MTQVDDWIKKSAMARQLRIQYEGAIYHLMRRGDRRGEIFRDDLDRKSFLATLGAACEKFCPGCYNYFSSYGAETLQSHFGCRTVLAGSLPSNPSGTAETLGTIRES